MIRFIDFLLNRRDLMRYLFLILVGGVMIWSLTIDTEHAHTWYEKHVPVFWSIFSLVSCIVLIFAARWLANAGIAREESYYDN